MADVPSKMLYGTAQTVINSGTDIAAGNFGAGGTAFDNTTDSAVPYALYAEAMLEAPDWAAAPGAGTVLELWGVLQDVDSTDDDSDAPSGTASGGARFFGAWVLAAADALQRRTITISLLGVSKGFVPYIRNGSAQNLNNDGGTNLIVKIKPYTIGVTV
jgi:hypothetical protein